MLVRGFGQREFVGGNIYTLAALFIGLGCSQKESCRSAIQPIPGIGASNHRRASAKSETRVDDQIFWQWRR
jgi:hypothetical protein